MGTGFDAFQLPTSRYNDGSSGLGVDGVSPGADVHCLRCPFADKQGNSVASSPGPSRRGSSYGYPPAQTA